MERKHKSHYLDLGTLVIYTLLSMAFAVAIIVFAALVMQADIHTWNHTVVASVFFVLTGGICGAFLLFR